MQDEDQIFTDEQVGLNPKIAKKINKCGFFPSVFKFFKKRWLIIVIIVGIAGALTTTFFLIPSISVGETQLVNIDTTTRLELGKTIKLKTDNVTAKIISFVNDTCPEGTVCFWSGQAINYELIIDGQKYATGSITRAANAKYQIDTISSDYKTYAEIKIVKSE